MSVLTVPKVSEEGEKMEGDVKKMEGNEKMEGKAFGYTIKDVLTPDQFQYLQTQLRLSRSFGRCSDDTLHALLQSTPVYPTPPLAHL